MKFQIRPLRLRADPNGDFSAFIGGVVACILVFVGLLVASKIAG